MEEIYARKLGTDRSLGAEHGKVKRSKKLFSDLEGQNSYKVKYSE